jgi:hypothetical protein
MALSPSIALRSKITIPVILLRQFSTKKSPQQILVKNSCQHSLQLTVQLITRKSFAKISAAVFAAPIAAGITAGMSENRKISCVS